MKTFLQFIGVLVSQLIAVAALAYFGSLIVAELVVKEPDPRFSAWIMLVGCASAIPGLLVAAVCFWIAAMKTRLQLIKAAVMSFPAGPIVWIICFGAILGSNFVYMR